ncbi:MAG: TetR/AcrR family transcriptional regulator [Solirubrobacteraceae bacterium]
MPRWEPDAPARLQQAALALYAEHGYDRTTAADIAQHAGLNRRTFFRHFSDKREAVFWGSEILEQRVLAAIETADEQATPLEMILTGLRAGAPLFQDRRQAVLQRRLVIDATPELQERERTKLAHLVETITDALCAKGVECHAASIAGQTATTILHIAFVAWADPANEQSMIERIDQAVIQLKTLVSQPSCEPSRARP